MEKDRAPARREINLTGIGTVSRHLSMTDFRVKFIVLILFGLLLPKFGYSKVVESCARVLVENNLSPAVRKRSALFELEKIGYDLKREDKIHESKILATLSKNLYKEARDMMSFLRDEYPTDKYYHIYVGRSGVMLAAMESNIDPERVINLPYSGAHLPGEKVFARKRNEGNFNPLSRKMEQQLFTHFKNFLPSSKELGDRTILLIDYASSAYRGGSGLRSALTYLSLFNKTSKNKYRFEALALVDDSKPSQVALDYRNPEEEYSGGSGIPVRAYYLFPDFGYLAVHMRHNHFDGLAEYGRYNPGLDKSEDLVKRSSYLLFKYKLAQSMLIDKSFLKNLSAEDEKNLRDQTNHLRDELNTIPFSKVKAEDSSDFQDD